MGRRLRQSYSLPRGELLDVSGVHDDAIETLAGVARLQLAPNAITAPSLMGILWVLFPPTRTPVVPVSNGRVWEDGNTLTWLGGALEFI